MQFTLDELYRQLGSKISGVTSLDDARAGEIGFVERAI